MTTGAHRERDYTATEYRPTNVASRLIVTGCRAPKMAKPICVR
jgi:hypothetical protein